jgi:hypothetical protein
MPTTAARLGWGLVLVVACTGGGGDESARGEPCRTDAPCGSLRCIAEPESAPVDLGPLAMSCGDPVGDRPPLQACSAQTDCEHGICLLAGACARPCAEASDCAPLEHCQAVFARTATSALQTLTACVATRDLPDATGLEISHDVRPLPQGRSEIALPPVAETERALHVLEHPSTGWPEEGRCRPPLCVQELWTRDPEPVLLFDAGQDYAETAAPLNPVAVGDHLDPAVVMLPSASGFPPSQAGYSVVVEAKPAGELRFTRIAGPADVAEGARRLDLNLFYVGARDLRPEGDRGPPLIAEALDVVDEVLGQAQIVIGEVRQIEVTGDLPQRGVAFPAGDAAQGFAFLQVRFGVYVELPSLFRLSAGAGNAALNLFFVADIELRTADGEPQAEAGGIPGPLGLHGTGSSGIAIATDMMAGDPQRLGRTLAHELAHFLGLFHTSEADGSVYDGLQDTPECRIERDLDGDGLQVPECADAGADNLMFWAITSGTVLTGEQRALLRAAVILQ